MDDIKTIYQKRKSFDEKKNYIPTLLFIYTG